MKKVILAALGATFLLNCGQEEPSDVEVTESALTDQTLTDASGDVTIKVRTCDWVGGAYPGTSGPHCTYCTLPAGWDIIGGGAEIEGSPSSARLRASLPLEGNGDGHTYANGLPCTGDTTTTGGQVWQARSDGSSPHRLRAYVVGIQIPNVHSGVLTNVEASYMEPGSESKTPSVDAADAEFTAPILGGGASEAFPDDGLFHPPVCFLTESYPIAPAYWRASASCSAPSRVSAVHISLTSWCTRADDWDKCLSTRISSASTPPPPGSGYRTATVTESWPWVSVSVGGKTTGKRYLTDQIPISSNQGGGTITTKDENVSSSGTTTAYSISILGGRNGPWMHNQIRFVDNSYFVRGSGTASVNLTQSMTPPPAFPNDGRYRWYVESVGSGQYRIRNSNPSKPGERRLRLSRVREAQLEGRRVQIHQRLQVDRLRVPGH